MFQNLSPSAHDPAKIVDLRLNQLLPVYPLDEKPKQNRVNFALAQFRHKIYFYSGLDEKNEVLDSLEEFDSAQYKFQTIKFRGDYLPKGRLGCSCVFMDQYNMFIFGGTKSKFLLDPEPITGEELVLNLDVDAGTFSQARKRNDQLGE